MRFKDFYLTETPIAYDDETDKKVGKMHISSKTKWGFPPSVDASVKEVEEWVKEKIKMNILKDDFLGTGSSRKAVFNDGKTIFKFNYGSQPWGNQTTYEVGVYEKYKNTYGDILAKILKSGKNWYIQEAAKFVDYDTFKKLTGVDAIVWLVFIKKVYKKRTDLKEVLDQFKTKKFSNDIYKRISTSDVLVKIAKFCYTSKIDIGDLITSNLGMINNKLVIIDYGFSNKMAGTL